MLLPYGKRVFVIILINCSQIKALFVKRDIADEDALSWRKYETFTFIYTEKKIGKCLWIKQILSHQLQSSQIRWKLSLFKNLM